MVWESQYQGHPTVEGGRLIKVSDIQEFDILPAQPKKSEKQIYSAGFWASRITADMRNPWP